MTAAYVPSHRANRPTDAAPRAICTAGTASYAACPACRPEAYADGYARHATDSFGPFVGVK